MHKTDFQHVQPCSTCHGKGEVSGAVMRIYCHECAGVGFLGTGDQASEVAGRIALAKEIRRLAGLVDLLSGSAETVSRMRTDNNKGPGGSNFTGD